MQDTLVGIGQIIALYLPNVVAAILILIVGWLLALLISSLVRRLLRRTALDNRLMGRLGLSQQARTVPIEDLIARIVFYLILLFVLIAVFQVLGLTIITQPLNLLLAQIFQYAPKILAAAALLLLAWLVASALRFLVTRALAATTLDDRLSREAGLEDVQRPPMSQTLGNVVYWFVLLLFLPMVLDALDLGGLLAPVQSMLNEVLSFLPNLLAAGLILLVGWFVARIIRQIVTGLLAAAGVDRLGERLGISRMLGSTTLSSVLGTLAYVLVLIPTAIAALNALDIAAITAPATTMLTTLLNALPSIFGAALVLIIAYVIGRLVAGLVTNILASLGFDNILQRIGLGREPLAREPLGGAPLGREPSSTAPLGTEPVTREPVPGVRTPSQVVGTLVLVGIMLFAAIEAANLLGFEIVAVLVAEFINFAAQVVLGLIILGLGLYLANLAYNTIQGTAGPRANLLAEAARIAVIVLSAAMALRQMGIANDIVNLAFGLLLGAIAIAVALSFGLGTRHLAAQVAENWLNRVRRDGAVTPTMSPPPPTNLNT
jgi:small-conductance mechanosensitive channel